MSDPKRTPRRGAEDSPSSAAMAPVAPPVPFGQGASGTVLVVDGDRVSARFVERALNDHGLTVEIARDAAAAAEVLRTTTVHLIVCDTSLPDMTGQRFLARILEDIWCRHIPVVFLSAEARTTAKVTAFRAGAQDYLTKPIDRAELAARCLGLIGRQLQRREEAKRRPYSLAGEFSAMALADLAVMLSMGRRTGTLYIVTKPFSGQLVFVEGNLVHAVAGNVQGDNGFYKMLAETDGRFEFNPTTPDLQPHKQTVTATVTALLMEAARIQDERKSAAPPPKPNPKAMLPASPPPSSVRVLRGLPSVSSGTLFEQGLSDPFTLGELQLWTVEQLAEWTADDSKERFHVLLVADPPVGTAALLALSSPPSQRFIAKSMTPSEKVLGLTFFLKRDAEVDIVLLDIRSASRFMAGLLQLPCLIVVSPPEGDFLAAGVRGRSEFELLLEKLMPPVLIGVGNASLEGTLRVLPAVANGVCTLKSFVGVLGEGLGDLRSVLSEGVRLWESKSARKG